MLDKSLAGAYGEPVHTHSLSLHLPGQSGSQEDEFLPDRRQTALRSVAGGEPHALLYGSSLSAKAFAQVKGKGHSHHTAVILRLVSLSLFAPVAAYANKCLFGQRRVRRCAPHAVYIAPPTAPDVAGQFRNVCVRRAQSARESVNTCGSRLAIDGGSQAHTARSGCSSTLGYALRSNPNPTIAASPMLDKSLVNALWLTGTHSRSSFACYLAYAPPPIDIAKVRN